MVISKSRKTTCLHWGPAITNSHNYQQPTWRTSISLRKDIRCSSRKHSSVWDLYTTEYHDFNYWASPFDSYVPTFAARRWGRNCQADGNLQSLITIIPYCKLPSARRFLPHRVAAKIATCESNALHWRHNGHGSVSNHQPHDCLLNRLFRRRSKKKLKLRVTGFCAGNSPGTGECPAQMASNAENVSIWWRHHGQCPVNANCHSVGWSSHEKVMTWEPFVVWIHGWTAASP